MKFAETLEAVGREDDQFGQLYLRYLALKLFIKEEVPSKTRSDTFLEMAKEEIRRIKTVFNIKLAAMGNALNSLHEMTQLCKASGPSASPNLAQVAEAIAIDLLSLNRYMYYNGEGFRKILKKYNRWCSVEDGCRHDWQTYGKEFEEAMDTLESMLFMLSESFQVLRTHYHGETDGPDNISGTTFERKSSKYWVAKKDVFALKLQLIKHLPLHVFQKKEKSDASESSSECKNTDIALNSSTVDQQVYRQYLDCVHSGWISSVYLDNGKLDCYKSRVLGDEGATLLRVRWYEDINDTMERMETRSQLPRVPACELFVERKEHHESWVKMKSCKKRFSLKEEHVLGYLNGSVRVGEEILSDDKGLELAEDMQEEILKRKLKPVVRTVYKRTAFQKDNNNDVRITLDSSMVLIKEWQGEHTLKDGWKRSDVEVEQSKDWYSFPYTVLEVKLQSEEPEWLSEIIQQPQIMHRHKFSKFQHACAVHRPMDVYKFPYWLSGTEIKAFTAASMEKECLALTHWSKHHSKLLRQQKREDLPVFKETYFPGSLQSGLPLHKTLSPMYPPQYKPKILDSSKPQPTSSDRDVEAGTSSTGCCCFQKKKQPKVATKRIKVEPKTFFANERTFIQWISASVLLLTLSGLMFTLNNDIARLTAVVIMPLALVVMLYATGMFYYRLRLIQSRKAANYSDRFGPGLLSILVLAAVLAVILLYWGHLKQPMVHNSSPGSNAACESFDMKGLPFSFEPSGLALMGGAHPKLFTCSDNAIAILDTESLSVERVIEITGTRGFDCEAVAYSAKHPDLIFVGFERPENILVAANLSTGVAVEELSLSPITGSSNHVFEGLAYQESPWWRAEPSSVRNTSVFNGYTFFVPGNSYSVTYFRTPGDGELVVGSKIQGLQNGKIGGLEIVNNILFILRDNLQILEALDLNTKEVRTFTLPGVSKEWEGIAAIDRGNGHYDMYLAKDTPSEVGRFSFNLLNGFSGC